MRKKRMVMVALLAVVVVLALGASAAFAKAATTREDGVFVLRSAEQVIRCNAVPCYGSSNDDLLYERKGNGKRDKIILKGGDDQVRANRYTNDKDVIKGSSGFDLIYVDDGDKRDRIFGGKGNDKCYVDSRTEVVGGCSRIIVR